MEGEAQKCIFYNKLYMPIILYLKDRKWEVRRRSLFISKALLYWHKKEPLKADSLPELGSS